MKLCQGANFNLRVALGCGKIRRLKKRVYRDYEISFYTILEAQSKRYWRASRSV